MTVLEPTPSLSPPKTAMATHTFLVKISNALGMEPHPLPEGLLITTNHGRVYSFSIAAFKKKQTPEWMNWAHTSRSETIKMASFSKIFPNDSNKSRRNSESSFEPLLMDLSTNFLSSNDVGTKPSKLIGRDTAKFLPPSSHLGRHAWNNTMRKV